MNHSTSWVGGLVVAATFLSTACADSHANAIPPGDAGVDAADASFVDVHASVDSGCDGAALPDVFVGGFWVVGNECGGVDPLAPTIALLSVGACGEANTYFPDGLDSSGTIAADDNGEYAYRSFDERTGSLILSFRIASLVDERAGSPVLELGSLDSDVPWKLWAIRQSDALSAAAPRIDACASSESWSLHALEGVSIGDALDSGVDQTVASNPFITLGGVVPGESSRVRIAGAARWGFDDTFDMRITEWTGSGGSADGLPCRELDDAVQFNWDGTTLVLVADWLLPDASDLDGDGRTNDFLVRRTRTEFRADACP